LCARCHRARLEAGRDGARRDEGGFGREHGVRDQVLN